MPQTLAPGQTFPTFAIPQLSGGTVQLGGPDACQLIVVYRGQHCPMCKDYLATLETLRADFAEAGVTTIAASADSEDQARGFMDQIGYAGITGYAMTEDQMQALGLYLSAPRTPPETDHVFPEPGLFYVDKGVTSLIDISTAPFLRPDLQKVLNGILFTREKGFPIRGRHGLTA